MINCHGEARKGLIYEGGNVICTINLTNANKGVSDNCICTCKELSVGIYFRDYSSGYRENIASQSLTNKTGNQIAFVIPQETTRIEFYINTEGSKPQLNNAEYCSKKYRTFMSIEDARNIKKTFLNYVLALVGVVFISLPLSILNLKQISEDEKRT